MQILNTFAEILFYVWAFFTLWPIGMILQHTHCIWKDDWFWFATKSAFWLGWLISLLWGVLIFPTAYRFGMCITTLAFLAQAVVASFLLSKRSIPTWQKAAWYAIPFFISPLWFAYSQAQRRGEIPVA